MNPNEVRQPTVTTDRKAFFKSPLVVLVCALLGGAHWVHAFQNPLVGRAYSAVEPNEYRFQPDASENRYQEIYRRR